MNLQCDNKSSLRIIKKTGEEREMFPVYDSDNHNNLNILEETLGLGKFYGWQDKEGNFYLNEETEVKLQCPYDLFGIECGPGWYSLLTPIFKYIEKYNSTHADNPIIIEQIKEKFAELRIYTNFSTDELDELINTAEKESLKTCEFCGATEDIGITVSGWYKTCCHDCVRKNAVNNTFKREYVWKSYTDNNLHIITPEGNEMIKPNIQISDNYS